MVPVWMDSRRETWKGFVLPVDADMLRQAAAGEKQSLLHLGRQVAYLPRLSDDDVLQWVNTDLPKLESPPDDLLDRAIRSLEEVVVGARDGSTSFCEVICRREEVGAIVNAVDLLLPDKHAEDLCAIIEQLGMRAGWWSRWCGRIEQVDMKVPQLGDPEQMAWEAPLPVDWQPDPMASGLFRIGWAEWWAPAYHAAALRWQVAPERLEPLRSDDKAVAALVVTLTIARPPASVVRMLPDWLKERLISNQEWVATLGW